ncbi:hypothetical protein GAPWKB11_0992 [Gilliamella apicola]|nr:hypothetical protein GAPWKB11_0992 [Gilliamella apicola]
MISVDAINKIIGAANLKICGFRHKFYIWKSATSTTRLSLAKL